MTSTVYTEARGGGDRVYLGALAPVGGLQWAHGEVGGPLEASFDFHADIRYNHRALTAGRDVTIVKGAGRQFSGTMAEPARGTPWKCKVDGDGSAANTAQAYEVGGNALDLDAVLAAAVARDVLDWTLPTSMPTGSGTGDEGDFTITDALNKVTDENSQIWNVGNYRRLTLSTPPTVPTYLLCTSDPAGGRTRDGYVTAYLVKYVNSATGLVVRGFLRNTAEEAIRTPVEEILDLTDRGPMTTTRAVVIGTAWLARNGPRLRFKDAFTLAPGQVRTMGGSVVDNATVRPPFKARLFLTNPDHLAETNYAGPTQFRVARTDYDDTTGVLTVLPVDATVRGFVSSLVEMLRRR